MTRQHTLQSFEKYRLNAIIRTSDAEVAAAAMRAAITGGFRIVEFTLTTPGALRLIESFTTEYPQVQVGAGTVLSVQQAQAAVSAGASFLVSPVCDREVIAAARKLGVVMIPGTYTATEMETAHRLGADLVKLFPAPPNVAEYISLILGPLPHLKIIPTAGVDGDNMLAVLAAGAAGIGFTSALFKPEDLQYKNYRAITNRARIWFHLLAEYPGITPDSAWIDASRDSDPQGD